MVLRSATAKKAITRKPRGPNHIRFVTSTTAAFLTGDILVVLRKVIKATNATGLTLHQRCDQHPILNLRKMDVR
jgi:hypothetical protein